MKTTRFVLALAPILALASAPRASAQCTPGPHTGTITADEIWCAVDSPHAFSGDVTVAAGVTLTIEAGSVVNPRGFAIQGHLVAIGTGPSPITFTAGSWAGLTFAGGTGHLAYTKVVNTSAGITATDVPAPGLAFDHSTLGPGNGHLTVTGSVVSASGSTFETNASGVHAISVTGASSTLSLSGNTFTGTGSSARLVFLAPDAMTGADFTLPSQAGLEAYHLGGGPDYTIPAGRTVTVGAGATVHSSLVVRGRLVTTGTEAQPVRFTAHWQWHGITFDGGTGLLSYAQVLVEGYGGAAVKSTNAPLPGLVLDHCSIGPGTGGISSTNGPLSVTSTTFTGVSSGYPIAVYGSTSTLSLADNTFTGNTQNQVFLAPDAMTGADFTLPFQTGLEAYHLGGGPDYTIPAGRTVTVAAGARVHSSLVVRGRLVTTGTAAQPVRLTAHWQWHGITFDGGTGLLSYAQVLVPGYGGAGIKGTNVPLPGLVLEHCSFEPGSGGLSLTDSPGTVTSSSFTGITSGYPIAVSGSASTLSLIDNTFTGNTQNRIFLETGAMTGADFTLVPQAGLDGYEVGSNYTIPAGRTVTVAAGTTVQAAHDGRIITRGRLVTNGTQAAPVAFTAGRWLGLLFDGGTGHLTHARVLVAGFNTAAITATNVPLPGLVLDHASVGPGNGGLDVTDTATFVNDSTFETNANGRYAIAVSGPASTLSLSNNVFGGTGSWARQIGLAVGAMSGSDFTLVPEPTLDAYVLARDYTVPLGRTMTVAAGATIIPSPSAFVQGRLVTNGTAASPVTFRGSRWTLVFDGGFGELRGTLLRDGGFNDPAVTVRNQGTLLLERSRVVNSNRIRTEAATLTLRNTAFLDGYRRALEITAASTLTAIHTTLARSADTAVVVQSGSTATLTNTIFAASPRGVNADATSTVTLTNTLWDAVPTPTSGSVTQHGLIVGSAAFEADGYHVGATSAALAQGVVTAVADDLDGEPRPRPVGLLADLGADENDGGSLIPGRTATPIAVGETKSATAPAGGFADFVLDLAPGAVPNLAVRLTSTAGIAGVRLLARSLQFPLATVFDAEGVASDAQTLELLVLLPASGKWYLSALATGAAVPFEITVGGVDRAVTGITPAAGGNGGTITTRVSGAGFVSGSRVDLRNGGVTLRSFAPDVFTQTAMTLRMDLTGLAPQTCDVVVAWPDGVEKALPNAFQIVPAGPSRLFVTLLKPHAVRPDRPTVVVLEYRNDGTQDVQAPLFTIESVTPIPIRLGFGSPWSQGSIQVLGIDLASEGAAGTLPPGTTHHVPFQIVPRGAAHELLDLRVSVLSASGASTLVDWPALEPRFHPTDVPSEAWQRIWPLFTSSVGATWGEYHQALLRSANGVSSAGRNVSDPSMLLRHRMAFVTGSQLNGSLASSVDAYRAAPGAPLGFGRLYSNSVEGRFRVGSLGRGWTHDWDVRVGIDPAGNASILQHGGARGFLALSDGQFKGAPGEHGTLRRMPDGTFLLTDGDGSRRTFRADGLFASVRDIFGNGVDLDYDALGRLVSLRHTAGDRMDLTLDGAGRIVQLHAPGGETTRYVYDSFSRLVSATVADGRSFGYGYAAPSGGAADHALTSVTLPDGSHRTYAYDGNGRLVRLEAEGGSPWAVVGYHDDGRVTCTTADGQTRTVQLDDLGRFGLLVGPLGDTTRLWYDADSNPMAIRSGSGQLWQASYGARGEVLSRLDPAAGQTDSGYRYPAAGGVHETWRTDPAGHTAFFERDTSGAVLALRHADGSRDVFTRDARGLISTATNRRGQSFLFAYDAGGRLLETRWPDGRTATITYDALGRPVRALAPEGVHVVDYDAFGLASKLTGPSGHWFERTRDAVGRLLERTGDDGFVLRYESDAQSRLTAVRTGAGQLIVRYERDAAGRITREERGNGTATSYEYDAAGQTSTLVHYGPGGSILARFDLAYDSEGNVTERTGPDGTTHYGFDSVDRLTSIREPSGRTTAISYDPAGNRTSVTVDGSSTTYENGVLNQVTRAGPETFTYDADGNVTSRTGPAGTTTYDWDAAGHLVRVVHPVLGTFDYVYDALGRRISESRGGTTTRFEWDGATLAAEYDGSGSLVSRTIWGLGVSARISASGAIHWYGFDESGNTLFLTDAAGAVVNRYAQDPWGVPVTTVEAAPNRFRMMGRSGVLTGGDGLSHTGARPYDPALGRFLSADPLRYQAGTNLYAYADGNPLRWSDPTGLLKTGPMDIVNKVVGFVGTATGNLSHVVFSALGSFSGGWGVGSSLNGMYDAGKGGATGDYFNQLGNLGLGTIGLASSAFGLSETIVAGYVTAAGVPVVITLGPTLLVVGGIAYVGELGIEMASDIYTQRIEANTGWKAVPNPYRQLHLLYGDNPPKGALEAVDQKWGKGPEVILPMDPNEKVAPSGAGPRHYVRAGSELTYTVYFENVATAAAPAQEVFVHDVLAPALDLSTLRLVEVAFGDTLLVPPADAPPVAQATWIDDYRADDARPWRVDVSTDAVAGRTLGWTFRTIDPETGDLPVDPYAGFLPQNDASGRGEGHVTFAIATDPGTPPGTVVRNSASIVFDTNAPIVTEEVFNTIGLPGDVNDDGFVNPADVFYLVNFFYSAGPAPLGIADVNFDGRVDALDLFYLINTLYAGGPAPL